MKIYFDIRWSGNHGIGRVSRVLEERLKLEYLEVSGNPASPFDPMRLLLAMLKLPSKCLVFNPGYNAPFFLVRPYIFIIHDLNHIDRPENSNFLKKLYYRLVMRRACKSAFKVLTVSEFSRQRIIDWADVPESHVVNIGNGVDDSFSPTTPPFSPGYEYLLCVSNRKPHKNEKRLLVAFSQASIDVTIRIVFTGKATESLLQLCENLQIKDRVVFLGFIPDSCLPGLYRGALALLFPSLYEGFGLPVVEAMACGTPVVTSKTTSLPEVAGDAALLVDPLNTDEITQALERIVNDAALRAELTEKGLARARQFTWDDVVDKVKHVLVDATCTGSIK